MMKSLFKIMMALIATLAIHSCTNDDMMQDIVTNAPLKFEIGDYPAYEDGARIIGIPDVGKTDWVDGDIVLVKVISETSTETFTLTYGNKTWTAGKQVSAIGTPTIEVIYAPECQWGTDGNIQLKSVQSPYGTFEYMVGDCNQSGSTVSVNFYGKRTYSRLRLVPSNISGSIDVTTTGFTPAGPASTEVPAKYTLQTDSKGNAYLYGTFASNAVITVKKDNVLLKEYKLSSASTIGKSYAMEVTDTTPYVTFTAEAQQTLTMSKAVETLEYSVNGGKWETLGTTTVTFGGDNGNLRLRGKSAKGTASSIYNYSKVLFGNEVLVACKGDIRTLVDYNKYSTADTYIACFAYLFENCISLTTPPQLPATTLNNFCYHSMFKGCTSLEYAPELPTTNFTIYCFSYMFSGCKSLVKAPELPSDTLEAYCYSYMFVNCTSLTTVPTLPATTLAESCYSSMFSSCTSLTIAPDILATRLADNCCEYMFSSCISLESPPVLNASTLAEGCYYGMFNRCSNLTEAPALPATSLADKCYESMFFGCENLVKVPDLLATNLTKSCYRSMFSNCTSLIEAPELPATKLAEDCYWEMFYGCNSLTEAPELPATTLVSACYLSMFEGCKKLKSAPILPATTLANGCYSYMFKECLSLTIAPELPATKLAISCYANMFYNCSSLTQTPYLPATTLVEDCYHSMFAYCTNLNEVTMLATDISANYCLTDWICRVSSSGTFTKAQEMTTLPTGQSGIPSGWTVKDYEDDANLENPKDGKTIEW